MEGLHKNITQCGFTQQNYFVQAMCFKKNCARHIAITTQDLCLKDGLKITGTI